jgi:AcrR family transcriptional regulator
VGEQKVFGAMAKVEKRPAVREAERAKRGGRRKGDAEKPALRKGERTAAAILDAAEALFAERGYMGTTMRTVAKAVGLRDPSLYNHFASKDALYAAVLERTYRLIEQRLENLLSGEASYTEVGRALGLITDVLSEHPTFVRLLQIELLTNGGRLHPVLERWLRSLFGRGQEVAKRLPVRAGVDQEERLLRILALNNVVLGYCTSAPLYEILGGRDLLCERVRRKQERVLRIINEAFERTPPGGSGS